MSLYYALHRILVTPDGPLPNLFALQLPDETTDPGDVDVAFVPVSGTGPTRQLGSRPVTDAPYSGPGGIAAHDGGVAWYHDGVQFEVRGWDGADPDSVERAMEVADQIRDTLVQYAGTPVIVEGEEIVRCEITSGPSYIGQDERERNIMLLIVEVWHNPGLDRGA